jgi:hypothetical protein
MNLIKTALAAMFPDRLVTRDFLDPAQRTERELRQGIYTLLSSGEGNYTNVPGYSAQEGRQDLLIVADVLIDESKSPSQSEDAEFDMVDEIKAFVRGLPDTLCAMNLLRWEQSGQVAHPRGWVVFQLEYIP